MWELERALYQGNSGNSSIAGSGGDDAMLGHGGNDDLSGTTGNDVYGFDSTIEMGLGGSRDVITVLGDIILEEDLTDVSTIDASTAVDGHHGFSAIFVAAGASFAGAGQIRVIQDPGNLTDRIIQFNTDNDAALEAEILVRTGGAGLDLTDFALRAIERAELFRPLTRRAAWAGRRLAAAPASGCGPGCPAWRSSR